MQEGARRGQRDGQADIVLHQEDQHDARVPGHTRDGVRWRQATDEEVGRGGPQEELRKCQADGRGAPQAGR